MLYLYRGKLLTMYYFMKGYLTQIPPLYSTNKLIIETTHVNICDCFEVPFIEIKLQIEKLIIATLNYFANSLPINATSHTCNCLGRSLIKYTTRTLEVHQLHPYSLPVVAELQYHHMNHNKYLQGEINCNEVMII